MVFNRKRKDNRSPSFILDDSPKRTKVQAQRKFAQGSNVNSPVLTPVKEIECQERTMPEPVELLPMKRPNTEDFLTFLCFRGTPVLPPGLNFFNSASMVDSRPRNSDSPSTSPKNGLIFPSSISKTQGERPFIAFGVRKRADPIVVSRHMDKKRRHALALQALRRKYQEQKMAKIRAITISKLSEKVQTNKTVVRTTRSITKSDHTVTKKNMASKTKITVVSTKRVKVTTRRTSTLKQARKVNVNVKKQKQKMCLRSYRGRFVQRELVNKPVKKRAVKQTKSTNDEDGEVEEMEEENEEEEEEFSSDDDEPLLKKAVKTKKIINKKPSEKSYRLTRSNQILTRRLPKAQSRILVRPAASLKSPPNSPRLRSQLKRKLKVVKQQEVVKTAPLKKKHLITKKVDLKRKVLRDGKIREVEIKKTVTNDKKSEEKAEEKRITRDAQRKINDEDDKKGKLEEDKQVKVLKVEDDKKKITKRITRVEVKVTKTQAGGKSLKFGKKKGQPVKKVNPATMKNKTVVKKTLNSERKLKEEKTETEYCSGEDETQITEDKKKTPAKNNKINEDEKDENKKAVLRNKKALNGDEDNEKKPAVKGKKENIEEKRKISIKNKKTIDADDNEEKKKGAVKNRKSINDDGDKEKKITTKTNKKGISEDEDNKKKTVSKGKKNINEDELKGKKVTNENISEKKAITKSKKSVIEVEENDQKKIIPKNKKAIVENDENKKKITTRSKNEEHLNSEEKEKKSRSKSVEDTEKKRTKNEESEVKKSNIEENEKKSIVLRSKSVEDTDKRRSKNEECETKKNIPEENEKKSIGLRGKSIEDTEKRRSKIEECETKKNIPEENEKKSIGLRSKSVDDTEKRKVKNEECETKKNVPEENEKKSIGLRSKSIEDAVNKKNASEGSEAGMKAPEENERKPIGLRSKSVEDPEKKRNKNEDCDTEESGKKLIGVRSKSAVDEFRKNKNEESESKKIPEESEKKLSGSRGKNTVEDNEKKKIMIKNKKAGEDCGGEEAVKDKGKKAKISPKGKKSKAVEETQVRKSLLNKAQKVDAKKIEDEERGRSLRKTSEEPKKSARIKNANKNKEEGRNVVGDEDFSDGESKISNEDSRKPKQQDKKIIDEKCNTKKIKQSETKVKASEETKCRDQLKDDVEENEGNKDRTNFEDSKSKKVNEYENQSMKIERQDEINSENQLKKIETLDKIKSENQSKPIKDCDLIKSEDQSKKIKDNEEVKVEIRAKQRIEITEDRLGIEAPINDRQMECVEDEIEKSVEASSKIVNEAYSLFGDLNSDDISENHGDGERNTVEKPEIQDRSNEMESTIVGTKKMKTYSNTRLKRITTKNEEVVQERKSVENNEENHKEEINIDDAVINEERGILINDSSKVKIVAEEEEIAVSAFEENLDLSKLDVDLKKAGDFTLKIDHSANTFEVERGLASMYGGSDSEHDSDDEDTALKICSDEDDDHDDKQMSIENEEEIEKNKMTVCSVVDQPEEFREGGVKRLENSQDDQSKKFDDNCAATKVFLNTNLVSSNLNKTDEFSCNSKVPNEISHNVIPVSSNIDVSSISLKNLDEASNLNVSPKLKNMYGFLSNLKNANDESNLERFSSKRSDSLRNLDGFSSNLKEFPSNQNDSSKLRNMDGFLSHLKEFSSNLSDSASKLRNPDGFSPILKEDSSKLRNLDGFSSKLKEDSSKLRNPDGFSSKLKEDSSKLRNLDGFSSNLKEDSSKLRNLDGFSSKLKEDSSKLRKVDGFSSNLKEFSSKSKNTDEKLLNTSDVTPEKLCKPYVSPSIKDGLSNLRVLNQRMLTSVSHQPSRFSPTKQQEELSSNTKMNFGRNEGFDFVSNENVKEKAVGEINRFSRNNEFSEVEAMKKNEATEITNTSSMEKNNTELDKINAIDSSIYIKNVTNLDASTLRESSLNKFDFYASTTNKIDTPSPSLRNTKISSMKLIGNTSINISSADSSTSTKKIDSSMNNKNTDASLMKKIEFTADQRGIELSSINKEIPIESKNVVSSSINISDSSSMRNAGGSSVYNISDFSMKNIGESRWSSSMKNIDGSLMKNIVGSSLKNIGDSPMKNISDSSMKKINESSMQNIVGFPMKRINESSMKNIADTSTMKINESSMKNIVDSSMMNFNESSMKNVIDFPMKRINESSTKNIANPSMLKINESSVKNIVDSSMTKINESSMKNVFDFPMKRINESPTKNIADPSMLKINESSMKNIADPSMIKINKSSKKNIVDSSMTKIKESSMKNVIDFPMKRFNESSTKNIADPSMMNINESSTKNIADPSMMNINESSTKNIADPSNMKINESSKKNIVDSSMTKIKESSMKNNVDSSITKIKEPSMKNNIDSTMTKINESSMKDIVDSSMKKIKETSMRDIVDSSMKKTTESLKYVIESSMENIGGSPMKNISDSQMINESLIKNIDSSMKNIGVSSMKNVNDFSINNIGGNLVRNINVLSVRNVDNSSTKKIDIISDNSSTRKIDITSMKEINTARKTDGCAFTILSNVQFPTATTQISPSIKNPELKKSGEVALLPMGNIGHDESANNFGADPIKSSKDASREDNANNKSVEQFKPVERLSNVVDFVRTEVVKKSVDGNINKSSSEECNFGGDVANVKKSLEKPAGDPKTSTVNEISKEEIEDADKLKKENLKKEEMESLRLDAMISEMARELAAQDAQTGPRVSLQKQKKTAKRAGPVLDLPKRPSRKTKEAATVYMEILGHKLENEDLDDVSIDSFPELPNVKKMEQRENELKASLLQKKKREKKNAKPCSDSEDSIADEFKPKRGLLHQKKKERKKNAKVTATSDSDESFTAEIKTPPEKRTRQTRKTSPKLYKSFSDTDSESDLIPIKQVVTKRKSDADNGDKKKKPRLEEDEENFDEWGRRKEKDGGKKKKKSTAGEDSLDEAGKKKKKAKLYEEEDSCDKITTNKISKLDHEENIDGSLKKNLIDNRNDDEILPILEDVKKITESEKQDEFKKNERKKKTESQNDSDIESSGRKKKLPISNPKGKKKIKLEDEESANKPYSKGKQEPDGSDFPEKKLKKKSKLSETDSSDESDAEVLKKKILKKKQDNPKINGRDSFDESDEEPLVKLKVKKDEGGKQKRECTKKPQNYLPLFSSSEDEEKYFHGFVKCESPPKPPKIMKRDEPIDLLLTKDLGRRYGKEKVNMSNEQIEKWLNDSAMAGMSLIKKENDEMLKFGEKIPTENFLDNVTLVTTDGHKNSLLIATTSAVHSKNKILASSNISPEKYFSISPLRPFSKTIFRKEKNEPTKNINAFSVCNESSVYAFEADNEDSVNTPFRRPNRRPSSTATSRSEDDLGRDLDQKMNKFRHPNMMCSNKSSGKDASSLNISTDESNNSGSLTQKSGVKLLEKSNKPLAASTPMCPPLQTTLQKTKENRSSRSCSKSIDRASDAASEDFKYKIPSSPSASSSSSAKLYKRNIKKQKNSENYIPVNVSEFPAASGSTSRIVAAPVFHPNDKEFADPMEYIEKIRPRAEKFGICRIVPPPNFKPECKVLDEMRFTAYNQYVHKMMHRWGPNFRELVAIRKYLATQSISLKHPPWIGGMEIDLPRLYQTVQSLGGLKEVIEKKKWPKVSELMKIPKSAQDRVTKLDDIYCKYLLPYDTLSPDERDKLFDSVETDWAKRESKNLLRAQQSGEIEEERKSEEEESEDEDETDTECIVKGRSMALNTFYRIARNSMATWFKNPEPEAQEVEEEFWKHVTTKKYHICVHSGSIDSGNWGYGFAVSKNSPFARHAWNLKVLTNNSGSILRSMGPVMGLTVPTLHVGMVFSGCCWYRDPHSLPWIEYLHTGANKIWYGIPDSMSEKFHSTLLNLVPNYCLNKSIWLPSDTVMLPPELLVDNGVSLTRTVQKPGEFVVIFPKAFTSNICTGYVVSESVFFAPPHWLNNAEVIFEELKNSCEPSMFSYERLLLSVANDSRSDVNVLKRIVPAVGKLCEREKLQRAEVKTLGVVEEERLPIPDNKKKRKTHESEIEYACEDCRWNLFCSMVFDSQENGIYCLEHAINHLRSKTLEAEKCRLMFTYDVPELDVLVKNLNATIEAKMQKKNTGYKHYSLPTMVSL